MADSARNHVEIPVPTPPEESLPGDWASLLADLSADHGAQPAFRIHDRTHLELALDYPIEDPTGHPGYEWEAYIFVPESLRLDSKSLSKSAMYADLRSYMRYAVAATPLDALAIEGTAALEKTLAQGDDERSIHELRIFASQVRAACIRAERAVEVAVSSPDNTPEQRTAAFSAALRLTYDSRRLTRALRRVIEPERAGDGPLGLAVRWVDEDVSRLCETILGSLALALEKALAPRKVRRAVVEAAVAEARHRRKTGLDGVGRSTADKREVEHLEFRRNLLKRFTSSVLWLKPKIHEGSTWAIHLLYSLAAGIAMAFAIAISFVNGNPLAAENLTMWIVIAVAAYMGKDRIKAWLQGMLTNMASRRLPDRRWRITNHADGELVTVDEHTGFVKTSKIPEDVLARRRSTVRHKFEWEARPEGVIRHRKTIRLRSGAKNADARFRAITEIFRLDLRRWLAHTDDPKRAIIFADPDDGRVVTKVAPRVYNIAIVYRLRRRDDDSVPWSRMRVVVTRKGIRRLDVVGDPASWGSAPAG